MNEKQTPIRFTVIENGNEHHISTHHGDYANLMFLLKDELQLDSFGECGGVGRCATCLITTKGISGASLTKERNEPVTLSKLGYTDESTRLSCQLYITKDLNNAEITILEI